MKKILLISITLAACLEATAQKNGDTSRHKADPEKMAKLLKDSLGVSDTVAAQVYGIRKHFNDSVSAALKDSGLPAKARQQDIGHYVQQERAGLKKLLDAAQLQKLERLYGQKGPSPQMKERWEQQQQELADRFAKKKKAGE